MKVEIGLPDLIALRDQAARTGTLFQWSEIAIEWIEHYEKSVQEREREWKVRFSELEDSFGDRP